jgi:HD-GYP domain-containing protein (c-di-GMP phosphodiesterase class II)
LSQVRAISELERCAGTQFDPDVVAVFAEAWRQGGFELPTSIPHAAVS